MDVIIADVVSISIHAPRGGSDSFNRSCGTGASGISIHAPRGGSDLMRAGPILTLLHFNPRSPWGERRRTTAAHPGAGWDFNPRSPWGERRARPDYFRNFRTFQSTLPVGGATRYRPRPAPRLAISIHAPRGGSDCAAPAGTFPEPHFNPRSPWGERQHQRSLFTVVITFQSTLPVGGATPESRGRRGNG